MNLCSEGHDEVCYEGKYCPACTEKDYVQVDLDRANETIIKLETKIDELLNAIQESQNKGQ